MFRGLLACAFSIAFASLIAGAGAADAPTAAPPAPGCADSREYHQLDFWIGDWDTYETATPADPSEARAHVDPIAQGCALHELYEQNDGFVGDSILSYDPLRRQWQQTWVTNRGSIMQLYGGFKDDALVLEGEAHLKDGGSVRQRITWTLQEQGVRESALLSKDGGTTWSPAFDVVFRKHGGYGAIGIGAARSLWVRTHGSNLPAATEALPSTTLAR